MNEFSEAFPSLTVLTAPRWAVDHFRGQDLVVLSAMRHTVTRLGPFLG